MRSSSFLKATSLLELGNDRKKGLEINEKRPDAIHRSNLIEATNLVTKKAST